MSRHFLGFGNGSAGIIPTSGTYAGANTSCSGSASSTTLSVSSTSGFSANDYVLIDQSRGTGVGNWELNQIASVSSSLTMRFALENTYTDSGASQAQVIKILQYKGGTISGTFTGNAWNGNVGGILPIMCSGRLVISSSVHMNTKGFRGASASTGAGYTGEGSANASLRQRTANGNGGGGGILKDGRWGGGGGGGLGTSGVTGSSYGTSDAGGVGGSTAGSADLTSLVFGGGGGTGYTDTGSTSGAGGTGGGKILIFAQQLVVTGYIYSNGSNGVKLQNGGGGGAGGSILIKSNYANIGTNKLRVLGGTGGINVGDFERYGGDGGKGRIRVECCSLAGSVSSTYYGSYSALTSGLDWCYSGGAIL